MSVHAVAARVNRPRVGNRERETFEGRIYSCESYARQLIWFKAASSGKTDVIGSYIVCAVAVGRVADRES